MTAPQRDTVGDVFSDGAEQFHLWSPLLWDPVGEATVAVSAPAPGERVMDACCGAGASALPAARAVGAGGRVDAVDLSAGLLEIGADRARRKGLDALRFHRHDVTTWNAPDGGYDLVQCALGVFFFPDMDRGTESLIRLLRPGGRFTVTVWEKGALGDWRQALKAAVETEASWPDSAQASQLDRIDTVDTLTAWLAELGLTSPRVERRAPRVPVTPETAWDLAVGSRMRALFDGLTPAAVERVRARFTDGLDAASVTDLDVRFLIGTGMA
jgi:ubiquinone/menaquinone biosynthesis C-methylase UbiE